MLDYGLDIIDIKEWKNKQNDFYKNQIEEKWKKFVLNNKIPDEQYEKDLYLEKFLRKCDFTFRNDNEYISFSEYWHNESAPQDIKFDKVNDVNIGYQYTVATASNDMINYEWKVK